METHQTTDLGIAGSIPAGLVFLCIYSYIPPCVLSIWDYLYCYIIFKHSKTLKNDIVEKKLLLKYSRCKHVSLNKKKKKKKETNKQTNKQRKRKTKEKEKKKKRKRKTKTKTNQKTNHFKKLYILFVSSCCCKLFKSKKCSRQVSNLRPWRY